MLPVRGRRSRGRRESIRRSSIGFSSGRRRSTRCWSGGRRSGRRGCGRRSSGSSPRWEMSCRSGSTRCGRRSWTATATSRNSTGAAAGESRRSWRWSRRTISRGCGIRGRSCPATRHARRICCRRRCGGSRSSCSSTRCRRSTRRASTGAAAPAHVRSSWGLALLANLAVDRDRCADVAPLAEASAAVNDPARARQRPELLFLEAGCRLNGGHAREAAAEFATLLAEFPDTPHARDAVYYRFRALDVARTADPALTAEYEESLTTYLTRFPRADGAAEARYLLAELQRSRGDCGHAEAEYGRVPTGPFAPRARLGVLECRVAGLAAGKASAGQPRPLLPALQALVREAPTRTA